MVADRFVAAECASRGVHALYWRSGGWMGTPVVFGCPSCRAVGESPLRDWVAVAAASLPKGRGTEGPLDEAEAMSRSWSVAQQAAGICESVFGSDWPPTDAPPEQLWVDLLRAIKNERARWWSYPRWRKESKRILAKLSEMTARALDEREAQLATKDFSRVPEGGLLIEATMLTELLNVLGWLREEQGFAWKTSPRLALHWRLLGWPAREEPGAPWDSGWPNRKSAAR